MKLAYFYITEQGKELAQRLHQHYPGTLFGKNDLKVNMKRAFSEYDGMICIMATGIVVRILAPLFVHKQEDPAIIVMDSHGQYAISLLSGHLGGANELARQLADVTGGHAVITTASDVEGTIAFDVFGKKNHCVIENIEELKYISGALLDGRKIALLSEKDYPELSDPSIVPYEESLQLPVVVIDERVYKLPNEHVLYLRPKNLYVGIGCKAGVSGERIIDAIRQTFHRYKYGLASIHAICTIPKKEKEQGILDAAVHFGVERRIISNEEIEALDLDLLSIKQSDFVKQTVGVPSVSTASAYIASNHGNILVDKEIYPGITVSIVKNDMIK